MSKQIMVHLVGGPKESPTETTVDAVTARIYVPAGGRDALVYEHTGHSSGDGLPVYEYRGVDEQSDLLPPRR